jgi:hypothetical protein
MVGNVKTLSFKDNGGGVENALGFLFTLRALGLGFIVIALLQLEAMAAVDTLVLVDWHMLFHLAQNQPLPVILASRADTRQAGDLRIRWNASI